MAIDYKIRSIIKDFGHIKIDDMITMNVLQRQGTGLNLQSWKRLQYQLYHCPKVKLLIIAKRKAFEYYVL